MSEGSDQNTLHPVDADRTAQLWQRLKDHRVAQWTVAYVGLAYAIQHAVVLTSEAFEWPQAVQRASMLVLALCLPLVITFAWYHGGAANRRISGAELSILSVLLVGVSILFYVYVQPAGHEAVASKQSGITAARNAAAISLAVLPFSNLSGDASQESFSDGMTEEITSALARVPDLRVVARTSAYEFKGKNIDIRTMGQQLGATHLIEGSVRKAGERLRITAQLIKTDDGTHIWAQDYDRELTDIFAVQEDIARTIATQLRMPLGLKAGENLVANRAIDPDSYEQFLRAKAGLRHGRPGAADAIAILEPLVARSPNYAPAWEELGLAYFFMVGPAAPGQQAIYIAKAEAAGAHAAVLNPNSGFGIAGQVIFKDEPRKWAIQLDGWAKHLSLDPYRPDIMEYLSDDLLAVGRIKDALVIKRQLMEVEPLVPNYRANYAQTLWLDGQTDAAIKIVEEMGTTAQGMVRDLSEYYASQGRFQEAADVISRIPQTPANAELLRTAASLLRSAPTKVQAPEKLPALGIFRFIYLHVGAPERILDSFEGPAPIPAAIAYLYHPAYAPLRKTERFKATMRKLRIVDYWRERGWPSVCHPTTGDDFECT